MLPRREAVAGRDNASPAPSARSVQLGRVRPSSRTVMARERQSLFGARAEESVRISRWGYRCSLRSVKYLVGVSSLFIPSDVYLARDRCERRD